MSDDDDGCITKEEAAELIRAVEEDEIDEDEVHQAVDDVAS